MEPEQPLRKAWIAALGLVIAAACATTEGTHTLARRTLPVHGPNETLAHVLEAVEAAELDVAAAEAPSATSPGTLVLVERSGSGALVVTIAPSGAGTVVAVRAARTGARAPTAGVEPAKGATCLPCAEAALSERSRDRDRSRLETRQAARRLLRALDRSVGPQ